MPFWGDHAKTEKLEHFVMPNIEGKRPERGFFSLKNRAGSLPTNTIVPRHESWFKLWSSCELLRKGNLVVKGAHVRDESEYLKRHDKVYQKCKFSRKCNKVIRSRYTALNFIPKNLFQQFHRWANFYFLVLWTLNWLPFANVFAKEMAAIPLLFVLFAVACTDMFEDMRRREMDMAVNNQLIPTYNFSDRKYHRTTWSDLQVGDIVRVTCNSVIPADLLLLHSSDVNGVCFIETSNIDGESNLKQRTVVRRHWGRKGGNDFQPEDFKSIIECQTPNNEIYKFHGNLIPPDGGDKIPVNNGNLLLRGCVIRNTDYVEGIVVYAGHETKAMLNNNGPRYKRSKLERRMNRDVIYCVILLIIMCLIGAIGNGVWAGHMNSIAQTVLFIPPDAQTSESLDPLLSAFYMFWTMVILLQVLIPISLYVSIEVVKWAQVYMINNDIDLYHEETNTPMICRALNIPEDLGQIQFVFSDKTGTLTENKMVFRRCTVGGVDYPHALNAARIENAEPTPADMHPVALKQDVGISDGMMTSRSDTAQRSYRRNRSASLRPHHRRTHSNASKHHVGDAKADAVIDDAIVYENDFMSHQRPSKSKSVPNSPALPRRHHRPVSTKRPASHHRRNISSVSTRELQATMAHGDSEQSSNDDDDDNTTHTSEEDLETDVTPDPVLYRNLCTCPVGAWTAGDDDERPVQLSKQKERIMDFFVNLAICNTVVLSSNNNNDDDDDDDESKPEQNGKASEKYTQISTIIPINDVTPPVDTNTTHNDISVPKRFTADELNQIRYEAESPDEAALVYAARAYGCVLAHRSSGGGVETVTITLPNRADTITFEVLHTLPFDSSRKRMSVLVRDPRTKQLVLYCKGADSAILDQLKSPDNGAALSADHSTQPAYVGTEQESENAESNAPPLITSTKNFLTNYAHSGLRTLCMAKRVLTEEEYAEWLQLHRIAEASQENHEKMTMDSFARIETEFELLGATGIEDRLQEGVPETIEALREAGMQVWVVTGDKQETAVNIGYSCRLIHDKDEVITLTAENKESFKELLETHIEAQDKKRGKQQIDDDDDDTSRKSSLSPLKLSFPGTQQQYSTIDDRDHPALVLVIDGRTLGFALQKDMQKRFVRLARRCRSVLCCRATPLQKGEVVKLIREELHVMTLAIGDGANDVSMIQVADVGIGLSGQEGMQAVMSSDYAIAQFRFLRKLLLVHGHWNYARLASMVLYFFYKNAAFVFLIFWFQLICGFSGGNMIEQMYLLLFNLTITGFPPLVNGVFDKDLRSETLLRKPQLYKQGINDEVYRPRTFWVNIADAIYQSLVIFWFLYWAYFDSSVGLIEWGTVVTTAAVFVILIHLGIETKTWTWIHWAGQIGSVILFFAFALVYNAICPACLPPSNPYWIMERVIQTALFWLSIALTVVVALLPRYMIRSIQTESFPTECQKERRREGFHLCHNQSSTVTSSLASSSASTYNNPAFHPTKQQRLRPIDKTSAPAVLQRPDDLFAARSRRRSPVAAHAQYVSTPDLASTAPYYSNHHHHHNSNNSNSSSTHELVPAPPAGISPLIERHGATAASTAFGHQNLSYYSLSDSDSDDVDIRQIKTDRQMYSDRRRETRLAYERSASDMPSPTSRGDSDASAQLRHFSAVRPVLSQPINDDLGELPGVAPLAAWTATSTTASDGDLSRGHLPTAQPHRASTSSSRNRTHNVIV